MKSPDETGKRYGLLQVLERAESKVLSNGVKYAQWLCKCDCGTIKEVYASFLRSGQVKSCGCLRSKNVKDWTGLRQGKLTVVKRAPDGLTKSGKKTILWDCLCDCGNSITIKNTGLRDGSDNCGCSPTDQSHLHAVVDAVSPTYMSWGAMLQRCLNPNCDAYSEYGGVGIRVHEDWKDFPTFLADMGERPEGCTLNRINSAMIYSKETCEWATLSIQAYDQKKRSTNKSGKTGVCWDKRLDKWEAYISVDRKKISLGFSEVLEEAIELRKAAEIKYYGWNKE